LISECLSLKSLRQDFEDGFIGVDDVVEGYVDWVNWIFYILLVRFNYSKGDYDRVMFRGVKRGDDKYSFLTCRKFDRLKRFGHELKYFNYGDRGVVQGRIVHGVLEFDSNRFSLKDAWLGVGLEFDRWIKGLRRVYGKISIVRVFESHESGYPHIHVILVFHDHVFNGRLMQGKNGRWSYRVIGYDFQKLKHLYFVEGQVMNEGDNLRWSLGYSDFKLVNSFSGGISYLSKYLVKATSANIALEDKSKKGIVGLAMCWIFHKRSFSMSGDLFNGSDEIEILSKSNSNSLSENSEVHYIKVGIDLYGNPILEKVARWSLFGFCLRFGVKWDDWKMHSVSGSELELVDDTCEVSCRSHYKINDNGIYV
jgi:hypothetical protein